MVRCNDAARNEKGRKLALPPLARGDRQSQAATTVRDRRRIPAPTRPKPPSIIAHVAGSGTAPGKLLLISGISVPVPVPVKRPTVWLSDS